MSRQPGRLALVPEGELLDFVRRQRWFGAKGREAVGITVLDEVALRDDGPGLGEALVEIRYGSGAHEVYQLLIAADGDGPLIGTDESGRRVVEAIGDAGLERELVHRMRAGDTIADGESTLEFHAAGAPLDDLPDDPEPRPLDVEQSNSSVVLAERVIVKAYRRLEAGVNPELELLRFLGERGFANVPELRGWWSYTGPATNATLGIMQGYVADAVDGWSLACEELPVQSDRFLDRVERLGDVIGTMHALLASDADDPAFAPEETSPESLALVAATMDDQIGDVFLRLPDDDALAPIAGRGDGIRELLRGLAALGSTGRLIRNHGDLHLGQVLWAGGDWVVVDFEGEPARPLSERRRKRSPLRDVAGMLRSFAYAASVTGGAEDGDDEFEERARAAFLSGYYGAVQPAGILPRSLEETERLIRIFELEKAVYELRYELAHRPDWVEVPVAGIVRLLERTPV